MQTTNQPETRKATDADWADYMAYLDSGRPMGGYYEGWDDQAERDYEPPSVEDAEWWAAFCAANGNV